MVRIHIVLCACLLILVTSQCHVDGQPLRIGAFNIQVFGLKKAAKPDVMKILVKIIRRYDLLLIQEIRDSSGKAIYKLLAEVNANQPADKQFQMALSPRLGRTSSKEQYAYLYRPGAGLAIDETIVFDDGDEALNHGKVYYDLFQREPYLVRVRSQYTVPSTFVIIGIHVAPEQAVEEINALEGVFAYVQNKMAVQNVVAMGDLNADCSYVSRRAWAKIPMRNDPRYTWLIGDEMDTTVKHTHCAYDRFIFTGKDWSKGVDPKSAVVYEYDDDPKLLGKMSFEMAKLVSDHYPIEFLLKRAGPDNDAGLDISLCGVTILLDREHSLEIGKVYTLRGSSVLENSVRFGKLRWTTTEEGRLLVALTEVQRLVTGATIEVRQDKRKYGEQQKAKVVVHVGSDGVEAATRIFKGISRRYRCSG